MILAVCYTHDAGVSPLALPEGVLALAHHNFGRKTKPLPKPIVSSQAVGKAGVSGVVINHEARVPSLGDWTLLWRSCQWGDVTVAHGIDAGVQGFMQPTHAVARALLRPVPAGAVVRHRTIRERAHMSYDGYKLPQDTVTWEYRSRMRPRLDRLVEIQERNQAASLVFTDVQNQYVPDAYGNGLVLHSAGWMKIQIDAAVSRGLSVCIFAGASTSEARKRIDPAILEACEYARDLIG